MKKSFTFIEVIISITIFSIVLIMMYKTLNLTKLSDNFFLKQTTKVTNINTIKKIIFEDIIESLEVKKIKKEKHSNDYFTLKTSNVFHKTTNKFVTYFVSKENNLIRIESNKYFDISKVNYDLLEKSFIDILLKDVVLFKISYAKKIFSVAIKQKNEEIFFVNSIIMNSPKK